MSIKTGTPLLTGNKKYFHVVNAYSGIRGKALFLPRLGNGWRFTPRPLHPREITTVPTENEAGWAPETA